MIRKGETEEVEGKRQEDQDDNTTVKKRGWSNGSPWLRALAGLADDPGSISRIHMVANNCL